VEQASRVTDTAALWKWSRCYRARCAAPQTEAFAQITRRPNWIFGHPWFLLRGLVGAQTETSLAAMVYNLKRMLNVLGGTRLRAALVS
jgi:hypothetical protein